MNPSVRPSVGPSHSLRATPSIEMGGRLAFISCESCCLHRQGGHLF